MTKIAMRKVNVRKHTVLLPIAPPFDTRLKNNK